jgi:hypothetical protein
VSPSNMKSWIRPWNSGENMCYVHDVEKKY